MKVRTLGETGISITPIGLGCMQFSQGRGIAGSAYTAVDQAGVTAIVGAALDGGITWFDSAEGYGRGRSERALTTALERRGASPDHVVIATKWLPLLRTARSIGQTIGARQRSLQGYPVTLHQIHGPWSFSRIPAQMREMARLVRAADVQAVGVSNFSARQMEVAAETLASEGVVLASNQVQVNLLNRRIETNGVLETARRLGVTLIAYSPLSTGVLTGRFHEDPARVRSLSWMRRLAGPYSRRGLARTAPLIDELRAVGRTHGVTPAQVALNWLVTFYGESVVAIPGATKPQQATESAAAMGFELTEEELARIDERSRACATGRGTPPVRSAMA